MENITEKMKSSAEEYSEYLPGVLMTGLGAFTWPMDGGVVLSAGLGTLVGAAQSEKQKRELSEQAGDLRDEQESLKAQNETLEKQNELLLQQNDKLQSLLQNQSRLHSILLGIVVSGGMYFSLRYLRDLYKRHKDTGNIDIWINQLKGLPPAEKNAPALMAPENRQIEELQ